MIKRHNIWYVHINFYMRINMLYIEFINFSFAHRVTEFLISPRHRASPARSADREGPLLHAPSRSVAASVQVQAPLRALYPLRAGNFVVIPSAVRAERLGRSNPSPASPAWPATRSRRRHVAIRLRAARVPWLPVGGPGVVHPI